VRHIVGEPVGDMLGVVENGLVELDRVLQRVEIVSDAERIYRPAAAHRVANVLGDWYVKKNNMALLYDVTSTDDPLMLPDDFSNDNLGSTQSIISRL